MYNKEYLENISKKLDSLNKASGNNPQLKKEIENDGFDFLSHLGNAGRNFLNNQSNPKNHAIDPLFRDHNKNSIC
jgi:hypothetical protein